MAVGLKYSHTLSPFGVISKNQPQIPRQMRVLPFASRCAPETNGE